ncbi:hypothetical protein ACHQM5_012204 [Ranunculus cassubicifolius]
MAASNDLASFEPWSYRTSTFPDSWISDTFARETESSSWITKALQQSLSNDSNNVDILADTFQNDMVKIEPGPTGSVSDPDMFPKSRRNNGVSNGKITKRKSRASKRSPTTFIAADPANFRQMVQQVTGIQFGDAHMPVTSVLKPEPYRPGNRIQNYGMPTLDTSAFLLDNNRSGRVDRVVSHQQNAPQVVGEGGGNGLDFGNVHNFPTLESWRVM